MFSKVFSKPTKFFQIFSIFFPKFQEILLTISEKFTPKYYFLKSFKSFLRILPLLLRHSNINLIKRHVVWLAAIRGGSDGNSEAI